MSLFLYNAKTLHFIFLILLFLSSRTNSINFQIPRFDSHGNNIVYQGDAITSVGAIELINKITYVCRVGWATYAENMLLWDVETGKLADFRTRFALTIDNLGNPNHASGFAFFLGPVGFQIPPNSGGGFLGLYNTTSSTDSSLNQIVHVEFDTFPNPEWDPPFEHVGINSKSIFSSYYTSWNSSLHSGDTADVFITYNASTKYLNVSWSYQKTPISGENTSLSYQIDLSKVLPEWVTVGFTAATSYYTERYTVESWEFYSSLEMKDKRNQTDVKRKTLILGLTIPGFLLIVGAIFALVLLRRYMVKKKKAEEAMNLTSINEDLERGAVPRRFSYKDLVLATNNFSDERKLGEGGFGAVYRGFLPNLDEPIAVKRISKRSKQGKKEYITEIKIISRLRHRNLVQLIGWCHDSSQFLLVYKFMPNRSLDYHIFGKRTSLPWALRYKITLGLASAILYLHEEWEQCIVHRDIKSSNVMLDSNFNVKLGDFGLARLMDHELGIQTTGLAGTLGYLAPEYIRTGRASKESDVYSFGVVVLEIATGRKSVDPMEKDSQMGLVEWVWDLYGKGNLLSAADKKLQMKFEEKQIECSMIVGIWCSHPDPNLRPSVRQTIQVLNLEVALPDLPPKMPIPMYHIPTTLSANPSSHEPFITASLESGR